MEVKHFVSFHEMAPHDQIVSMVNYKDLVVIATQADVYVVSDNHVSLMKFEVRRIAAEPTRQTATMLVANWMMSRGYATGHGDTVDDLLCELEGQVKEHAARAPS
jgi:hypothetical protein